jgi:DNA polymerase-4
MLVFGGNMAGGVIDTTQRIVHVDINSYFATMLQQENPYLRGKPVGVVKDVGRTCIIAASKEAKKLGITTGCRLAEAKVLAPNIITVPAEFDLYLDCTRRMKRVFTSLVPDVDIFSLDEAFLDLTHCQTIFPDLIAFGRLMQQKIKEELGEWVTCNVGISYTRLLAKMAGEMSPKGSVTEITPNNRDSYLASASFRDVCGIGFALEKKLASIGVTNPYQLNFCTLTELENLVGPFWSQELLNIAKGNDSHTLSLIPKRRSQPMKMVGRSITGYRLTDDENVIKQTIYNLCTEAAAKVRQMNMAGRHVGIYLLGQNQSWMAHKTHQRYICHTHDLFDLLYNELYLKWERHFQVIKFGIFLGNLKPISEVPISLFPAWHQQERVYQALDAVNEKFGLFTLRPATLVDFKVFRPEVTGFLGDKTYYGL